MDIESRTDQFENSKVLWVSPTELTSHLFDHMQSSGFSIIHHKSFSQLQGELKSGTFSLLFLDWNLGADVIGEVLNFVKQASVSVGVILLIEKLDPEQLQRFVNNYAPFDIIIKPIDKDDLLNASNKAYRRYLANENRKSLILKFREQNDKLEELTFGLEQIVHERTLNEEKSKKQAEEKLNHVRSLVRFIKELAFTNTVDDWILLFRKSLKSFSSIRQPILCYATPDRKMNVVYMQKQQVVERQTEELIKQRSRIITDSEEDRHFLANFFGRPFGKIISIPIFLSNIYSSSEGFSSVLFIEHGMDDKDVQGFLDYLSDRLQPLQISLERILLEYQLRYTSYQWASTFDGLAEPIAIVDYDYNLIRSNKKFELTDSGSKCFKRFNDSDESCRGCPVKRALKTGRPQKAQIKRGDSYFEVQSYPIRVGDNTKLTAVINYYLDMTQALALRGRVIQNEKMAAIGLLAGNIAHELNNPLTGIRSLSQVLISTIQEQQVKDDLKEIEVAAERCQNIIDNLLSFSNSEETRTKTKVDMSDIVKKTLPILKTAMRDHNVGIELSSEEIMIKVEIQLFQQVIFNLINNACQAMEDGGELVVETSKQGSEAQFLVRDTGPGIPPEILSQIFEPFFTTKEEGKGTGLGLSMSRSVIESFGGRIEVDSQIGTGTTFKVLLPIYSGDMN